MLDQTKDPLKLTEEQLRSFWEQGYIAPVTVYTPEEMTKMWNSIRVKLLDRKHAAYALDSHGVATNIANYDRHLDVDELASHICNDVVVAKLQQILGPDVLCWRTEFFPKYPGDEGTDWHQADTFANASGKPQILWPDEDEDNFGKGTITVWTAFTRADKCNGCLQIIPSTHLKMNYDEQKEMAYSGDSVNNQEKDGVQRGFFGYDYRELQIDPDFTPDEANAVPLELAPGQCAIFWSTLMHASYPNTETDAANYRMGFAARYVPSDVKIYPDTDEVVEYGGRIPLDNYGAVVVSGESRERTNTVFTHSLTGFKFDALA